jgi:hypothetical protein
MSPSRDLALSDLLEAETTVQAVRWVPICLLLPLRVLIVSLGLAAVLSPYPVGAQVSVAVYSERTQFLQALDAAANSDDYQAYSLGQIGQGLRLGEYSYSFDPTVTQPAVVSDGGGGSLLGGYPYNVFVGSDVVSLALTVSSPSNGDRLRGFGADFYFAPSYSDVSSNSYRIMVGNGTAQGQYAGNAPLPGDGGVLFLGLIASPGDEFTSVSLSVVQGDPDTIVPACQVDNLVYLKVRANPPLLKTVTIDEKTVALQGNGGMPGAIFYVRGSTNVAQPFAQWPRVGTNYFAADGSFSLFLPRQVDEPAQFYTLEVP